MVEDVVGQEAGVRLTNDWVFALVILRAGGGGAEAVGEGGEEGGANLEVYGAGCGEGIGYGGEGFGGCEEGHGVLVGDWLARISGWLESVGLLGGGG